LTIDLATPERARNRVGKWPSSYTGGFLSLALGIGANTAIYSFMDSLLLRSLPVADPESLAVMNWRGSGGRDSVIHGMSGSTWSEARWGEVSGIFPYPAFELIRTNSSALFSSVFAYYPTRKVNVMLKGQADQASGGIAQGDDRPPRAAPINTTTDHDDIARIVKETISALYGNSSTAGDRAKKQRGQIVRALTEAKGRAGGADGAAARLRVNRTTLPARMKKLGIDPRIIPDIRPGGDETVKVSLTLTTVQG
jgi:hypothetical protein